MAVFTMHQGSKLILDFTVLFILILNSKILGYLQDMKWIFCRTPLHVPS